MRPSTRRRTTPVDSSLLLLQKRHRALLAELADIGLVLRGSIAPRLVRCGQPTCPCKTHPPRLHGPYYLWTRKVAGKTVTAQLTPEHAALCQDWNPKMKKLDRIVRQMQAIGLRPATIGTLPLTAPRSQPPTRGQPAPGSLLRLRALRW